MTRRTDKSITDLTLVRLIPNMLTLGAVCAGITAIRFAIEGNAMVAVQLILLAAVLDGLDGRAARFIGCDSAFGLELDSLADFLNFGVAPALIVYFWSLQGLGPFGWSCALAFAICCILRLARFNVMARCPDPDPDQSDVPCSHFTGVPAPAGALLALAPLMLSFAFADRPALPPLAVSLYLLAIGLLMVSRVPTPSFKTIRLARDHRFVAVALALLLLAALATFEWITLLAGCAVYLAVVLFSFTNEWRRSGGNG